MCSTSFSGSLFSASWTRLPCALFLPGVQFQFASRPGVLPCSVWPSLRVWCAFLSNSGLCFLVYFICSRSQSPWLRDVNLGNSRIWLHFSRDRKGQSYPVEYCLESVEEYSEGRVHKSEPEPRNGNVNTVYFNNQARGNSRSSRTEFVYDEREHAMANFYLYLNFLLRICS